VSWGGDFTAKRKKKRQFRGGEKGLGVSSKKKVNDISKKGPIPRRMDVFPGGEEVPPTKFRGKEGGQEGKSNARGGVLKAITGAHQTDGFQEPGINGAPVPFLLVKKKEGGRGRRKKKPM